MPRSHCIILSLVVAGAMLPVPPVSAQAAVRIRWPLVDFLVRGDTAGVVQILASPNLASVQSIESTTNVGWVAPEPAEMLQWAIFVRQRVDSLSHVKTAAARLVGVLYSDSNRAFLGIALDPAGEDGKHFKALFADSLTAQGWQAPASAQDIDELLDGMAQVASWVTHPGSPVPTTSGAGSRACPLRGRAGARSTHHVPKVLVSPRIEYPPVLAPLQREGRVWVQFRIDTTGTVDTASACVLLADEELFATAVRRALPGFRFAPVRQEGRAIEVLAYQEFRFMRPRR